MLKFLNGSGAGQIIRCDDYQVHELANGLDEVEFQISIWDSAYPLLTEETQIQDRDRNIYLVKQIDGGDEYAKIIAAIDLDEWKTDLLLAYNNGITTVYNTLNAVKPSGWTVVDVSGVTIRRQINGNLTPFEVCEECLDTYGVWIRWDNAAKVCTIHNRVPPEPVGAFATRDLNLKQIQFKGKSTDIKTRLYAVGKDGMTFASINGGKPYVDNFSYTSKILPMYWKDERYTIPENLLHDAREKLAELAVPDRSYECAIVDLQAADPEKYGFLDFSLYTTATLIDDVKQFSVDYQVVERRIYPYRPEANEVTFDSAPQKITTIVDNTKDMITALPTSEEVQTNIDRATGVLQSGKSGFLVLGRNADGYANEIYLLDKNSLEEARQVLRINKNGIGFSSTGYQGPYYQAWTLDGVLSLGGTNNAFGNLQILDKDGNVIGSWDKDGLQLTKGSIELPGGTWDNNGFRLTKGSITLNGAASGYIEVSNAQQSRSASLSDGAVSLDGSNGFALLQGDTLTIQMKGSNYGVTISPENITLTGPNGSSVVLEDGEIRAESANINTIYVDGQPFDLKAGVTEKAFVDGQILYFEHGLCTMIDDT